MSSLPLLANQDGAMWILMKEECDFKYDGLCEVPVSSTCIIAYAEVDFISAPSVLYSIGDWPKWLRPAKVNILLLKLLVNIEDEVEKRGPLIHVYDLPPEYNSLLLELSSTLVLEEDDSG
nr:uncharacterized protein LOC109150988 [Ipomoea trifida]